MRSRLAVALLVVLAAALSSAPAASANAFQDLFREYQKTGKVDGCKHSAKKLADAQRQVPNDIEQYAPDFPAALEAASAKKASGGCKKKSSSGGGDQGGAGGAGGGGTTTPTNPATGIPGATTTPGATTPTATTPNAAGTTPQPTPDPQPAAPVADNAIPAAAQNTSSGADDAPAPLVLLFIVGGLLLAAALGWAAAQWFAWEPAWVVRARHAGAEAGWRASAAWSEFTDWVRLGR